MQNLITSSQMQEVDAYTIQHLPISSIDLMEKAAKAFVKCFKKEVKDKQTQISILCGTGNNGGDGLAIARWLHNAKYGHIIVYLIQFSAKKSDDYTKNLKRLSKTKVKTFEISSPSQLEDLQTTVIIDAILGSGLNKPLTDKYEELAAVINNLNNKVIAVDVPTGFNTEGEIPTNYNGIKAALVISFQRPKLNFFFPESAKAMDRFIVATIGLDENFIQELHSDYKLTTKMDSSKLLKPRKYFSHKGTYGHALIFAGNTTTMGAALLSAGACLHAGAGLTTLCLPQSGLTALNTALPEVMALPRNLHLEIAELIDKFNAIAIGPGLGLDYENRELLEQLIALKKPMIIDADALTMLSKKKELLDQLAVGSILTPHMKEFDRLFGEHETWWARVQTAKQQAKERQIVILLKNQYTFVCLPSGDVHINPTGNPGMASGGMGDVLTGIIAAFVAQAYSPSNAAILATYLHGKTGDRLAKKRTPVTATQIILKLPVVLKATICS